MSKGCADPLIQALTGGTMAVRVRTANAGPGAPLVLHLHGGAFHGGWPADGSPVADLLAQAGAVVVSVDYPAGAAHPFPEALEASFGVLQRLYKDRAHWAGKASRLFVAGEEAGGNLAAALAMIARDRCAPALAGQILLSPMLDAGLATCSMRSSNAGPVGCKWADGWHSYLGSADKACHPYANPASASRLAGLAPALVLTAQDDPMRDESLGYARRLRESGVVAQGLTIAGPTLWPDALISDEAPGQPEPEWRAQVLAAVLAFFAAATGAALPLRASSSRR